MTKKTKVEFHQDLPIPPDLFMVADEDVIYKWEYKVVTKSISERLIDAAQKWAEADGKLRDAEGDIDSTEEMLNRLAEELEQAEQAFIELAQYVEDEFNKFKMIYETSWTKKVYNENEQLQQKHKLMKELDQLYCKNLDDTDDDEFKRILQLRKQLFGGEHG